MSPLLARCFASWGEAAGREGIDGCARKGEVGNRMLVKCGESALGRDERGDEVLVSGQG